MFHFEIAIWFPIDHCLDLKMAELVILSTDMGYKNQPLEWETEWTPTWICGSWKCIEYPDLWPFNDAEHMMIKRWICAPFWWGISLGPWVKLGPALGGFEMRFCSSGLPGSSEPMDQSLVTEYILVYLSIKKTHPIHCNSTLKLVDRSDHIWPLPHVPCPMSTKLEKPLDPPGFRCGPGWHALSTEIFGWSPNCPICFVQQKMYKLGVSIDGVSTFFWGTPIAGWFLAKSNDPRVLQRGTHGRNITITIIPLRGVWPNQPLDGTKWDE